MSDQTNTRSENTTTYISHPDFIRWEDDWKTLNDTVDGGQTEVKRKGEKYLPATSGQRAAWSLALPGVQREKLSENGHYVDSCSGNQGCIGQGAYAYYLYKFRAVFYDYPSATVRQMVGRLTNEPPVELDLPGDLKTLETSATSDKQDFESLIETIFTEQCKYSRCGVLADFPAAAVTRPPYLTVYGALRVLNWETEKDDNGEDRLKWVVLDESKYVQTGLTSEYKHMVRICALDDDGNYFTELHDLTNKSESQIKSADYLTPSDDAVYPNYKGKMSKEIPFVFINATNISPSPELPILSSVSSMSLAVYRGEADYRQALFVQGQSTPTFTGATPEEAKSFLLGANGGVASQSKDFKASYMEVSGAGLSEMRESQTALHKLALSEGMKLVEGGKNESGEALKERTDSQTVSLQVIASTCEAGLVRLLEIISEWGGVSGEIKLKLNREFTNATATPDDLLKMVQAYNSGAPITREDMHKFAVEGGLAESEWKEVEAELDDTGRNAPPAE